MAQDVFRENVVIITGASSGIGRALAYQLAKQGAWLVLAARNVARLEAVAESCRQQGGLALIAPTDVSDQAQCEHLVASTIEKYGRVDTLVNNAGISMWAPFEQMRSLAPFDEIMRTNYLGSVYCTYAALPSLKQRHGRIVVVSSLAGKTGVPTRSGYAASKHAQVGFFDSLRIELAPYGVSITLVCPDFVAIEIRERAYGVDGKPLGTSPVQEGKVMTADTCACLIVNAAGKRKREEIMGMRGKVGQWVKMVAPGLVDRIASRAITGTLTPNQIVSLIGTNSESSWYAVTSVGYEQRLIGWVPTIELQMKAPTGEMLYFTKTHLEADEASSIVEVLWPTMKVSLLGRSPDGNWVAVASQDGSKFKGWARASEVKVTGYLQTLPVLTTH